MPNTTGYPADGRHLGRRLRPEARPLPFDKLDKQQQEAFQEVVTLLESASNRVKSVRGPGPATRTTSPVTGPFLDHDRSSVTILVSGERGTGKTTLLLSLAGALASTTDPEPPTTPDTPASHIANKVGSLRSGLVWLETLDMEPLARSTNLLGAVLARVEDAVGARFPQPEGGTVSTSLHFPGRDYHESQMEMRRLQTSIALSFGGNLPERAGSLDPDNFASESLRAERERLGLNRRFAGVLSAMSADLELSGKLRAPVFVLPVDDLDLNPEATLRLMELLRAVHSPHLMVIIAADRELLSTILRLKFRSELAKIAEPLKLEPSDTILGQVALSRADDLAVNALRKHFPESQTVIMKLVEPAEALLFTLGRRPEEELRSILGVTTLAPDCVALDCASNFAITPSLDQLSAARPASATRADLAVPFDSEIGGYSWPEMLRMPWRKLIDFYISRQSVQENTNSEEDQPLRRLARERVDDLQKPDISLGGTATAILLPSPSPSPSPSSPSPSPSPEQSSPPTKTIHTSIFRGWSLGVSTRLDRADVTVVVGAADLLGEQTMDYAASHSAQRNELPLRLAPQMSPLRQTTFHGGAEEIFISWPWVTHTTFWGYERAAKWLAREDKRWESQLDPLFGSWISVMTAQIFDAVVGAESAASTYDWPDDWESLGEKIRKLPPGSSLVQRWLFAIGLLCTPEMGMHHVEKAAGFVRSGALKKRIAAARKTLRISLPEPFQTEVPDRTDSSPT